MFKICDKSISKPLAIISWSYLQNGKFASEWKKANVASVFKKKKKKQETSTELLPHFFIACFKQNISKVIIWLYV